ncbi:hypothetical protein CUS07_00445 [Enterococcus faecalis]|nr:hypothetical protein CUS33_02695 [Enterococcus faecalis]PQE61885.1 hypothetical protein CUS07_00445 [Enterococcus faecalis]PQE67996.1 hypothetical protein CUS03_03135 [Enterococcus faecalis]PQF01026.1 hypothetical protein CUS90_02000 [Enterococcus faecalis]PQF58152.1 hypothetical protein CUS66_00430 [Enterococcus faecalis]
MLKFKETKKREFTLSFFCVEYSEFSIKRLTLILFKGIMEDTRFKKRREIDCLLNQQNQKK